LVLRCNTASDVDRVFWFVNDGVYRSTDKEESVLLMPDKEGLYTISCSDDQGRNSTIQFEVIFL
jgi:penicillin-binding protein 1C